MEKERFSSLNITFHLSKMRCLDWTISRVPASIPTLSCINLLQGPNLTNSRREKTLKAGGLQEHCGSSWPSLLPWSPTRVLEIPLEETQVPAQGTHPDYGFSTRKGNTGATFIHSSLCLLLKKATLLHLQFKGFRTVWPHFAFHPSTPTCPTCIFSPDSGADSLFPEFPFHHPTFSFQRKNIICPSQLNLPLH